MFKKSNKTRQDKTIKFVLVLFIFSLSYIPSNAQSSGDNGYIAEYKVTSLPYDQDAYRVAEVDYSSIPPSVTISYTNVKHTCSLAYSICNNKRCLHSVSMINAGQCNHYANCNSPQLISPAANPCQLPVFPVPPPVE